MARNFTSKDIEDGKKISSLFSTLSEENKTMAIVYLSALRDKEIADSSKNKEAIIWTNWYLSISLCWDIYRMDN